MQAAVRKGAGFELQVARFLSRYSFNLRQVGGPHDGGIDLTVTVCCALITLHALLTPWCAIRVQGTWELPGYGKIPLLCQCKAETKSVSIAHMRQLEAAVLSRSHLTGSLPIGMMAHTAPLSTFATRYAQLPFASDCCNSSCSVIRV